MFEDLRETYRMTGAGAEFYEALQKPQFSFQPYLTAEYLAKINEDWLGLEKPAFQALLAAAEEMKKHPLLVGFAAAVRALIFDDSLSVDYLVHLGFPKPETGDRGLDAFFGLLVHLSGIDVIRERYEKRGIPLSYMKASYRSVYIWVESFKRYFGYYGHNRECPRMLYIEHFRFIRIGRLEYEPRAFYGQMVALKNRKDGKLQLLAAGGTVFREDGKINGTNEVFDPHSQVAYYEETAETVTGHAVIDGRIQPALSVFSGKDWEIVLRPGDPCINSHIPRDGKLISKEAEESFREAEDFFRAYFPEIRFRFFQCHSWLLDDVYRSMLGEESNIVQFQKLFTPFPTKSGDYGAMISVYTEAEFELSEWTPVTRLQGLLKEHYSRGGKVSNGGGIRPVSSEL